MDYRESYTLYIIRYSFHLFYSIYGLAMIKIVISICQIQVVKCIVRITKNMTLYLIVYAVIPLKVSCLPGQHMNMDMLLARKRDKAMVKMWYSVKRNRYFFTRELSDRLI